MKDSKEILELVVKAADAKRAEDIVALDVQNVSLLADYFVICSGTNERQIQAIVNEVVDQAEQAQIEVKRIEGKDSAKWILIDLNDVIVHVFSQTERDFYNLEKLWSDAPYAPINDWIDA